MWIFDLSLLTAVSCFLGMRSLYLGVATFVLGLLIEFQNQRVRFLLGDTFRPNPVSRKIKAGILACLLAACLIPLAVGTSGEMISSEKMFTLENLLPLVILIGIFSSAMMSVISIEKRKR